jgi:hypothetical protein
VPNESQSGRSLFYFTMKLNFEPHPQKKTLSSSTFLQIRYTRNFLKASLRVGVKKHKYFLTIMESKLGCVSDWSIGVNGYLVKKEEQRWMSRQTNGQTDR